METGSGSSEKGQVTQRVNRGRDQILGREGDTEDVRWSLKVELNISQYFGA